MIDQDYLACRLCPRDCGVDRTADQVGHCGQTARLRVASVCAHHGEEPPISGTNGSGTVFFSGCACHCFFCQNHQISAGGLGKEISANELTDGLEALAATGVHNINFVTPDHFLPHVEAVTRMVRERNISLPFVYNASGYMTWNTARRAAACCDICLPDIKFAVPELAEECLGDSRYPELVLDALDIMVERRGFLRPWAPDGATPASEGVLVRHLVLPGEVENSLLTLETLYQRFGPDLPISLMSQFQPMPECTRRGHFTRRVTPDEYDQTIQLATALGFENLFVQSLNTGNAFVPDFKYPKRPFRTTNHSKEDTIERAPSSAD